MKFRELLTEELPSSKKAVSFEYKKVDNTFHRYTFKINKHTYMVEVTIMGKIKDNFWSFSFLKILEGKEKHNKKYDMWGMTETGNVVQVLSTVIETLKDFVKKQKPKTIVIEGEGRGRIKVYDLLFRKINISGYKKRPALKGTYFLDRISK